jgi:type I restriction enzyme S subunit
VSTPNVIPLECIAESVDYGVTASAAWDGIGPKFLRITDIQDGQVDWEQVPVCECSERELANARLEPGDIVFARTGATTGKSFLIRECPEVAVFASYLIRVRLGDKAYAPFVSHYFQTAEYWAQISSNVRGVAQPGVNATTLKSLRIPVPPLEEQRSIAAILDQAETLRTQRRQALTHLDTLTQSLFLEMFGEQSNFPLVPLDQVCELITDGTHYTPTYADEGVIFLSAKNVTSGRIDWERIKHIPESLHQELHKRVAPKLGDVLMAKNGTTGVAAIVDRDCTFDVYVSLALLRPSSKIGSVFLHAALNSPLSKKQFNAALKGIGVPNLHLKDIRGARIPVPPLALQQTFATRIQALEALKATHRTALAQLDALFTSLQQRAFAGEL